MENNYNANEMQQMAAAFHPDESYPATPYKTNPYSRETFIFPPIHPVFASGIESYLDPKYASDPAAFASRLPYFPFHAAYGMYEFEPAFIRKRNERERQRVKCVNEGYTRLREHLPDEYAEKRLSKVETLRGAIQYIKHLQRILGVEKETKNPSKNCGDDTSKKHESTQNNNETNKTASSNITTTLVKETSDSNNTVKSEFTSPFNKSTVREVTIIGSQIMSKTTNFNNPSCTYYSKDNSSKTLNSNASVLAWEENTYQNNEGFSNKNDQFFSSNSNQLKSRTHFADCRYQTQPKKVVNSTRNLNFTSELQKGNTSHLNRSFHTQFCNTNHRYPSKHGIKEPGNCYEIFGHENPKTGFTSAQINGRQKQFNSFQNNPSCVGTQSLKYCQQRTSPLNRAQYSNGFRTSGFDFNHNTGGSDGFKSDNSPGSSTFSTSP